MTKAEEIKQQIRDLEAQIRNPKISEQDLNYIREIAIPELNYELQEIEYPNEMETFEKTCEFLGEQELVKKDVELSVKQFNDLCSLIVEALSLDNFGEHDRQKFEYCLNTQFDCLPKDVKDHIVAIVYQATSKNF